MNSRPTGSKKGRLGAVKSSNGCITCKIRKVKCDEERPSCHRCLRTGRRCDGYQSDSTHSTSPRSIVPPGLTQTGQLSAFPVCGSESRQEIQSFEYFVSRILPGFTRIVDDRFWHRTIPQLSHAEPLIWHALIAMSCLIQYPQYSTAPVTPAHRRTSRAISDENHRRALTWYGRSIACLRDRLEKETENTRPAVAPIACMLYVCIECLQDHVVEAAALYRHAVSMVGLDTPDSQEPSTSCTARFEGGLDSEVRAILRHETMSHGLPVPRSKPTLDSSSGSFQAFSAAREELYALVTECQTFIQNVGRIKNAHGKDWLPSSDLIQQQEAHQADLVRWYVAFSNTSSSSSRPDAAHGADELELRSVLSIVYAQYFVWLAVCLSTFETAYDSFLPYFASIVEHAERVIAATNAPPHPRPVFLLESRVIPSLYFVAIKCRHPAIRRKALRLLRAGPQLENIWKAEPMALVAEKSLDVEESGLLHAAGAGAGASAAPDFRQAQAQIPPTDSDSDSNLPPECNRVYLQEVLDGQLDAEGRSTNSLVLVLCGWRQDEDLQWSRTSLSLALPNTI